MTLIIIFLWKTWHRRNDINFQNSIIDFDGDILHVKKLVYMASTSFKGKFTQFKMIKCFDIKSRPPLSSRIIQVDWYFSSHNCIKCNTNGALKGNTIISTFRDIFSDNI